MKKLKGYCSYCPKDVSDKDRIFEFNQDTNLLICPNCGKELNPVEAHHAYLSFLRKQVHKGDNYLDFYGKYQRAYQQYAYVISIEENSVEARFGRLLSLAYLSTVRKAYFNDCLTLLDNDKNYLTYSQRDLYTFLYFAKNMNSMAKSYATQLKKRLTTYRYFFDEDCAKLYFQRIYELNQLLTGILQEIKEIKAEVADNETLNKSYNSYNNSIVKFSRLLGGDANVLDGSVYIFDGMDKEGKVQIKLKKKYQLNHMFNYRHLYLYNDNKKHLIKDDIFSFSNNLLTALRSWRIAISIFILMFIASSISVFFVLDHEWLRYLFYGIAGFAGFFIIISLIALLLLRYRIKKVKRGGSRR